MIIINNIRGADLVTVSRCETDTRHVVSQLRPLVALASAITTIFSLMAVGIDSTCIQGSTNQSRLSMISACDWRRVGYASLSKAFSQKGFDNLAQERNHDSVASHHAKRTALHNRDILFDNIAITTTSSLCTSFYSKQY